MVTSQKTVRYEVHTFETAPPGGGEALAALEAAVGVIPNLAARMAESPELLKGFLALRQLYASTGFSAAEIQALSLVAAYENDCAWCMAFHTAMALEQGLEGPAVDALRAGQPPSANRLGALTEFARTMVRTRGRVGGEALESFVGAGFSKRQALDVVLGMGFSMLANYAGHLTEPALDEFLRPHAWTR
jgi:AhpD family alkylhydroperoxidase